MRRSTIAEVLVMLRDERLRAWAEEHGVAWEVSPHYEVHNHAKVQVAFDLTLAAPRSAACTGDPGCAACVGVWEGLKELALRVLPTCVRHEIDPFDASFHFERQTHWTPEILLVAEIMPEGTFEPVDEALRQCVEAVEGALRRLDVRERSAERMAAPR